MPYPGMPDLPVSYLPTGLRELGAWTDGAVEEENSRAGAGGGPSRRRADGEHGRRGSRVVVALRRLGPGDHGQREPARRRGVPARVPGGHLEWDAVPVQPRIRDAREQQPGP